MNKKPNILLITTDQQRFDTLAAAGYSFMKTPNLDRLATEGCLYENAYSPNPVCIPARHNLLTGLTAKFHGFDDNYFVETKNIPFNLPTFAQILSDHDYETIAIGKMHFQPYRRHNGFDRLSLMDEIPRHLQEDDYATYLKMKGYDKISSFHGVRHLLYMQPQQSIVNIEDHGTSWVANETIKALKQTSFDRPWMIWAGFIHPHPPLDVPHEWAHLYDDVTIPDAIVSKTPISLLAQENASIADHPTDKYLKRFKQLYYASISFVDDNIGKIIQQLETMNELDNTLIIFTSDHGEMLGDMGTYQKFLPYDGSCKIPFIARYPKLIKPNTKSNEFVDLNDLLPTFLDLANIPYPGPHTLPGRSILNSNNQREYQFVEHCRNERRWVSIRNHQFKYNYYFSAGAEELFDMIQDPKETTNLLATSLAHEFQTIKQDLKNHLIAYEKEYGLENTVKDNQFIIYDAFKPKFYRETNPPVFYQHQREENKQELYSTDEEIIKALKDEPIVQFDELDTQYFVDAKMITQQQLTTIKKSLGQKK